MIKIPAELRPADGRFGSGPSKVPHEAVAALADAAPGYLGTSHRQDGVRSVVRPHPARPRRPVLAPRRLRGADRQRRLARRSGTPPSFGLIDRGGAPLVIGEFSSKFAAVTTRRAAPRRSAGVRDRPRHAPAAPGPRRRRRLRVPAQRDVDRRDGPTSTGPTGATALVLVDGTSGAGGMRVDADRPSTSTTSHRRSASPATAACGSRSAPPRRSSASNELARGRPLDAAVARPVDRGRELRLDQTYNTPALATIFLLDHQLQWMLDQRRPRVRRRPLRHARPGSSTAGPRRTRTPRRS